MIPADNSETSGPDSLPRRYASEEVLTSILDQLLEIRQLAEQQGLRMLKYLIDMAVLEAKASLQQAKSQKQQRSNGS